MMTLQLSVSCGRIIIDNVNKWWQQNFPAAPCGMIEFQQYESYFNLQQRMKLQMI